MQPSPAKKVQLGWQSTLLPQPLFSLETAVVQHAAGRSVCGDVYSIFPDSRSGCTHLLLCDGMGTGSAAAQDGALSCSLLCRLLQNGFEVSAACSLVNAAFSLRQDTESACTVDLCRFDGLTGQAQLLKAGAAASWVLQGGRLRRIEGRTLPVGILDQVFCARTEVALHPGDLLVLASDGLDEFRAEAEKLLLASDTLSPQALCDKLLAAAKAGGLSDDLTILAARVSRAA